jgi:hypothetical protein
MAVGGGGPYARVSQREEDVESGAARAGSLKTMFTGERGERGERRVPPALARVTLSAPRVGALLVAAAAAVASSSHLLVPGAALLGVGLLTAEFHAVGQSLSSIAGSVNRVSTLVTAPSVNSQGETYIDALGTGAQSVTAIVADLRASGLARSVGDIDFRAFSHAAETIGKADIARLARDTSHVLEELQSLRLHANVQFQSGADGVVGGGDGAER